MQSRFDIILISNPLERYKAFKAIFLKYKLNLNNELKVSTTDNQPYTPLLMEYMQRQLMIDLQFRDHKDRQKFLPDIIKYISYNNGINNPVPEFLKSDFSTKLVLIKREFEWSEIVIAMLFKHDKTHLDMFGIHLTSITTYGPEKPIKECGVSSFIRDEKYDTSKMLEGGHVSAMTYGLFKENSLDCHCYILNASDFEKDLKRAFIEVANNRPVAMSYGEDNLHWFSCCLLPQWSDKNNTKLPFTVNVVIMDTIKNFIDHTKLKSAITQLTRPLEKLKPEGFVIKFHDMSHNGQQFGNACGLSTAFNNAAVIKTFTEYPTSIHTPQTFVLRLQQNLFCFLHFKFDENFIFGLSAKDLDMHNIIERLGYIALLRIASPEEKLKVTTPQYTILEFIEELMKIKRENSQYDVAKCFEEFKKQHGEISGVISHNDIQDTELEKSETDNVSYYSAKSVFPEVMPEAFKNTSEYYGSDDTFNKYGFEKIQRNNSRDTFGVKSDSDDDENENGARVVSLTSSWEQIINNPISNKVPADLQTF